MIAMAKETKVTTGHPGTWPKGEPKSVRDAADGKTTKAATR